MSEWNMRRVKLLLKFVKLAVFKKDHVGGAVEKMAAERGEATFLLFENESYSFAEFNRRANRRANLFAALGVGKGDVVGLMMENRPEILETLVGLAKLGAVTAGINTNLKGAPLIHCLKISGAKKAIVGLECLAAFKEALAQDECLPPSEVFVDTRWEENVRPMSGSQNLNDLLEEANEENPPALPLRSSDLFMFIYTSGTTGMPKAANITHQRFFSAGIAMGWYAMDVGYSDTVFCALPLYHSNGVLIAFGSALVNGASFAITRRFSASKFWEEAGKAGATCFIYIGELLRYLVNCPPGPHDRSHQVTRILGNGLRPDIWDEFQQRFGIAHIREFYASTEGNAVTINLNDVSGAMGKAPLTDNLAVVRYDVEKADYPHGGGGFLIACEPDEVGELLGQITKTLPFGGYTNRKETENKLLRNVFKKGDVFFKTGDLVKKDADGNFFFIDRIGDTYRWKGENVSTHEVAEILSDFPGIAIANVYGVEVPGTEGCVGMAALNMDKDIPLDPKALFEFTEEKLPHYARPLFLRLKPEMEVTGTYKLTKTELKEVAYDPQKVSDPLFFRDAGKGAYVPLGQKLHDQIHSGKMRL